MKTEEKILDYMDGTLSENESGELLHSLSVSPEKRVILEQHIKLRELTGLAQKPLAVPQALEASMAERFPAIAEYNRELAGGALIVERAARPSFIGRMAATVAAFMAQYPVRTGFAVAAASVIGYFAFAGGDRTNRSNATNEVATTTNPGSSMVNGRSSIVGEGNTNSNIQSSTADKVPSAIIKPSDVTPNVSNFSHQSNESHNSHSNSGSSPKANIPSHRDHIASNQAPPTTKQVKETENQNVANNGKNIPEKIANTPPVKTPDEKRNKVDDAPGAVATNTDGKNEKIVENPNIDAPTPAKDVASSNPAKENAVKDGHAPNVSLADNSVHSSNTEQNPFKNKNAYSEGFPFAVRVYGSLGGSMVNVHNNDATLANRFEGAALLGVDYIFDPYFSVGVEGGNAAISELITQSATQSGANGLPSISHVVVSNVVSSASQIYVRGVAHYTINPFEAIHLEASAGAGIAFASSKAPLVSAALFAGHDFSEHFGLSAGLAFAGAWTSSNSQNAAAQSVATGSDPIGYVTTNHATGTLFTPSYAFRVGLKFKPW